MTTRRLALRIALVLLVILVACGYYGLGTGAAVPDHARFTIDLQALRAAAGPEDALPVQVNSERVGSFSNPSLAVMAGSGFGTVPMGFYVWQIEYADGSSAVIDAVQSRATHEANGWTDYDDAAWQRQEAAVAKASIMAITHEHLDHIGGFTDSSHFSEFGPRLKLTAIQRQQPPRGGIGRTIGGEPTLEAGPEGSLHLVGPGIVAISAAGHTPGAQMFYLRLKGGRELLLIGDVVWQKFVLDRVGNRPRLLAAVMGEDGVAIAHQIRAVLDVAKANPSLDVVVSHDIPAMEARFASGAVGRQLR